MSSTVVPLCIANDATFWPWFTWSDFAQWPEPENTTVLVPLAGFTDWGLGHALDGEEQVLTHVLKAALALNPPSGRPRLLVVPPLRFVLGPADRSAFAVTPPEAIGLIEEVADCIAAAGFNRVILFNASPWNEELVDAVARDLRVEKNLQMFCVNLSALDLDFHPTRSKSRRKLQTLLTFLNDREPEATEPSAQPEGWGVDAFPSLLEPATPLSAAVSEGLATLSGAATHLASLLAEIAARPNLPNKGAWVKRTYP